MATRKRRMTAALIATAAVIAAIVWGAIAVGDFWGDVQGFDRTDIPGELAVEIEDTGTYVVTTNVASGSRRFPPTSTWTSS